MVLKTFCPVNFLKSITKSKCLWEGTHTASQFTVLRNTVKSACVIMKEHVQTTHSKISLTAMITQEGGSLNTVSSATQNLLKVRTCVLHQTL